MPVCNDEDIAWLLRVLKALALVLLPNFGNDSVETMHNVLGRPGKGRNENQRVSQD